MKGIDISDYQKLPDFTKVKAAGYDFVYVKATEGHRTVNRYLAAQANGAKNAGLLLGYYHFGHPENEKHSATEEAKWFLSMIDTMPKADLIHVLDVEQCYSPLNSKLLLQVKSGTLYKWILEYNATVFNSSKSNIILYSNKYYLDANLEKGNGLLAAMHLWLADYQTEQPNVGSLPKGWNSYALWQYTGTGKVDGVKGNCDSDELNPSIDISLIQPNNVT